METNSKEKIKPVITLIVRFIIHITLIFLGSLMYCCSPYDEWGDKTMIRWQHYSSWLVLHFLILGIGIFYGMMWRKNGISAKEYIYCL